MVELHPRRSQCSPLSVATPRLNLEWPHYDRLFTEEIPENAEGGFLGCLNSESLELIQGVKLEPGLEMVEPGFVCQFERIGYFCADSGDHHLCETPVFNRIIGLRDSWAKKKG